MTKPSESIYTVPDITEQTETILPSVIAMLDENQTLAIKPTGLSMIPFFRGGRDTLFIRKPSFPLHRGDIALYQRTDGIYVSHRVYKVTKTGSYYMLGDHLTEIEGPLSENTIVGVVKEFTRNDKKIDCRTDRAYNLLWRLWMFLRPIRPLIFKVKDIIKP